jgi:hypothetical protein
LFWESLVVLDELDSVLIVHVSGVSCNEDECAYLVVVDMLLSVNGLGGLN